MAFTQYRRAAYIFYVLTVTCAKQLDVKYEGLMRFVYVTTSFLQKWGSSCNVQHISLNVASLFLTRVE
jgi:hypothetical protein